jgi:hypothetical protein
MDKAIVIAELQRIAKELDTDCLSRSEFQTHAQISSAAVEKAFGTWNEAIQAAGLTPLPQGGIPQDTKRRLERLDESTATAGGTSRIPDEDLLRDLMRLARELGKRPSGNQISAKGKYGPDVYKRRWQSVAAAFEEAARLFPEAAANGDETG